MVRVAGGEQLQMIFEGDRRLDDHDNCSEPDVGKKYA
jgi:hypothetical protein